MTSCYPWQRRHVQTKNLFEEGLSVRELGQDRSGKNYQESPTDLTDKPWDCIKGLLPEEKKRGRPRELDMRLVVNAVLYVGVGGIQWRLLPKDYPKWKSLYHYFREWRDNKIWQRIHDTLRARLRQKQENTNIQQQVVLILKV